MFGGCSTQKLLPGGTSLNARRAMLKMKEILLPTVDFFLDSIGKNEI